MTNRFKIFDRVKYIGSAYNNLKEFGSIVKVLKTGYEIEFPNRLETLICYEEELTQIDFKEFEDSIKGRSDITLPYHYLTGYYTSMLEEIYRIGGSNTQRYIEERLKVN